MLSYTKAKRHAVYFLRQTPDKDLLKYKPASAQTPNPPSSISSVHSSLNHGRHLVVHERLADPVHALLDAAVGVLGDLLEGQALVDALDRLLDGRGDALDGALGVGGEVGDVALPAGRPLCGLGGEALLGAGQQHVEGGEGADAGDAEGEQLGAAGGGDADGHGGDEGRDGC